MSPTQGTNTTPDNCKLQPVPLLDIVGENTPCHDEIYAAIQEVFESGRFLNGPDVADLEKSIADISDAKFGIGCSTGSDALLLSLMALDIGPGDEVIVPSFTFFATASAVHRVGAKIVFADIEYDTFNLDPEKVRAAITPNTKAVIPVHLFGRAANMTEFQKIAAETGIAVIEDAAQAIGAKHGGQGVGSLGKVGCFSFYPTKNLGGCGDGGMLVTSDEAFAERLRLFGAHGMNPRYVHRVVGIASRLDTLQAAAIGVKLKKLEAWTEARRANAARYHEMFASVNLGAGLVLPADDTNGRHVWNQFTIRVADGRRDSLRAHLAEQQIGSEVYYPIPLHKQECFDQVDHVPNSLIESEVAAAEVLSLPISPSLTEADQRRVVKGVESFFTQARSSAA